MQSLVRSKSYDIVLLPESELATKAIRISRELEPLGTEYALGEERNFPHVSLYMVQLKDDDIEAVAQELASIAAKTTRLRLEADDYIQSIGYIDANYIKTSEIVTLQQNIVAVINPLRNGLRLETQERLQHATGLAKQNIEEYGEHRIGELFRPHLTFTRFTNQQPIPLEDMGAPATWNGTFATLALCELGPHGTCVRKIKEFSLQ